MEINNYTITVFTPTYNRANTLHRVFDSLCAQTSKDFKWLVVDDGSNDNTEEVMKAFIDKSTFCINYIKKENGGRHTALNKAVSVCDTPYMVNIDSDDALCPNAIEILQNTWRSLPSDDYERTWQVVGLCEDNVSHKVVGDFFPTDINRKKGKDQHKTYIRIKGEKCCCRKTAILKQFPFPVFKDTKFITESVVWERINEKYDSFCINDVLRVYYLDSPDSLMASNGKSVSRIKSSWYAAKFFINEHFHQIWYNKNIIFSVLNFSRCSVILHYNFFESVKHINKGLPRLLVGISYPFMYIYVKINPVKLKQ
jgi:glycosyltransferase involved in cell wall biosynthesis